MKGAEFSAIYERWSELQMDQVLLDVKESVERVMELQSHKRGKLEMEIVQKYKSEGARSTNPKRYLIAANWYNRWVKTIDMMKQGENVDTVSLKKRFVQNQQALVDDYVQGSNPVMHLSIQEKLEIYELVNLKTWYFLWVLYGEMSPVKIAPLVLLSDELEYHLKERERRLEALSQSTRANRRGGR